MLNESEGTIDLRSNSDAVSDQVEFHIDHIDNDEDVARMTSQEFADVAMSAKEKVRVKFDKFVNLVATHAFEEIFDKHAHEDVIISTDLLTDLASAHEEKDEKKTTLIFVVGILLGVAITWILLKT